MRHGYLPVIFYFLGKGSVNVILPFPLNLYTATKIEHFIFFHIKMAPKTGGEDLNQSIDLVVITFQGLYE